MFPIAAITERVSLGIREGDHAENIQSAGSELTNLSFVSARRDVLFFKLKGIRPCCALLLSSKGNLLLSVAALLSLPARYATTN